MATTVIDGKGLIFGRLASNVAEMVLSMDDVIVLNAEKIVVTGNPDMTMALFKHKVDVGECTKRKGPFYPRRADLLFKRCVRGMIPYGKTTGKEAYRRVHVFVGVPKQFQGADDLVRPPESVRFVKGKYITLGEIAERLGSRVR